MTKRLIYKTYRVSGENYTALEQRMNKLMEEDLASNEKIITIDYFKNDTIYLDKIITMVVTRRYIGGVKNEHD